MQSDFAPDLVHGVVTSKLDLAPIAHPGPNRKLTATKIAEAPFYIAIPDDHALAAKETLTLEDMHAKSGFEVKKRIEEKSYRLLDLDQNEVKIYELSSRNRINPHCSLESRSGRLLRLASQTRLRSRFPAIELSEWTSLSGCRSGVE